MKYRKITIRFLCALHYPEVELYLREDLNLVYAGCIMKCALYQEAKDDFLFSQKGKTFVPDALYMEGRSEQKKMSGYVVSDLGKEFEFVCGDARRYRCRMSDGGERKVKDFGFLYEDKLDLNAFRDKAIFSIDSYLCMQHESSFEMNIPLVDRKIYSHGTYVSIPRGRKKAMERVKSQT